MVFNGENTREGDSIIGIGIVSMVTPVKVCT